MPSPGHGAMGSRWHVALGPPCPGAWAALGRQASDVLHINFPSPAFAKRSSNPVSGIDEGGKRIRRTLIPPFQLRLVQPRVSPVRAPLHRGPGRPRPRRGPGRLQCGPLPHSVPGRGCRQQPSAQCPAPWWPSREPLLLEVRRLVHGLGEGHLGCAFRPRLIPCPATGLFWPHAGRPEVPAPTCCHRSHGPVYTCGDKTCACWPHTASRLPPLTIKTTPKIETRPH